MTIHGTDGTKGADTALVKPILVLYHANCHDGFGAALVAWQVLGDRAEYRAVSYGDPVPEIPSWVHVVYVLDFSFPAAVLKGWADEGTAVAVLDHHQTAEAELGGIGEYPNLVIRFEREKSGAVMAWEFFRDTDDQGPVFGEVPELLSYVQDRDLWRWELEESREVSAALATYPREFEVWDRFMREGVEGLMGEGAIVLRARQQLVEDICRKASMIAIGNLTVPGVNSPVLQSEICERLLELNRAFSMAACYFDKVTDAGGVRIWSLRSRPGFDCSKVAKVFGGGGHAQAAGFEQRFTVVHPAWTAPASPHEIGCPVYFGKGCGCGVEKRADAKGTTEGTESTEGKAEA